IRFESRVRQFVPADKQFWISNASLLLPGAAIGANGGGMMLINVAPKECQEVLRLVMEGKLAEAQTIQTRLLAPDHEILRHGAAGIKAAMTLLGYEMGLPRRPSPPCSNADVEQIRKAMDTAGLLPKS
ncbi:MAG: dihydrodipicolinate synthase family protein, partial [Planctomycetaceae bacterium]|nr:dihydrodipicolinate synthase family protein [Planctomycetaceae bacterium]